MHFRCLVGPFFYGMSFTFMTDVTADGLCGARRVYGYTRGLMRAVLWRGWSWERIGASLAMWAQTNSSLCVIVIPAVARGGDGLARSIIPRRDSRRWRLLAGFPFWKFCCSINRDLLLAE